MSKRDKTVPLRLTERELWLLKNGFEASFINGGPDDDDGQELAGIAAKVSAAWEKAREE